jgi:hypothetical protein
MRVHLPILSNSLSTEAGGMTSPFSLSEAIEPSSG